MKKIFVSILILLLCNIAKSQTKRVLFLGNSYTQVNDLPQMVSDMAASTSNTLIFDSNTPGGYTLQGHYSNATSISKIGDGNWDYVVLQEQSQLPSFPISQVETNVFPYAKSLDSLIQIKNPCAETIFYMTWGRKNGDASNCANWPPVCTYTGMDSLLQLRYLMMADSNNAIISPVAAVWKYIRALYPQIELYQSDESHPSVAGTYASALCFYSIIFRKDPTLVTFNASLSSAQALNIKAVVKQIVYDSLINWHVGQYDPNANFDYTISNGNTVTFTNNSTQASEYFWDLGNGNTSTSLNPTQTYSNAGNYTIKLIAKKCDFADTMLQTITISNVGINNKSKTTVFEIYPNPATTFLTLKYKATNSLSYKIWNAMGELLQVGVINNPAKQIDISNIGTGVYFIQLFEKNQPIGSTFFTKN